MLTAVFVMDTRGRLDAARVARDLLRADADDALMELATASPARARRTPTWRRSRG